MGAEELVKVQEAAPKLSIVNLRTTKEKSLPGTNEFLVMGIEIPETTVMTMTWDLSLLPMSVS